MNASEIYGAWPEIINNACGFYKLRRGILCGLFERESQGNENAIGDNGAARGLGQMHQAAAETVGFDWNKFFNPTEAIPASAAFLSMCIARAGSEFLGLAAYNQGPTLLMHWLNGAMISADNFSSIRRGILYARDVQAKAEKWTPIIPTLRS